jgi:hypothetical protein
MLPMSGVREGDMGQIFRIFRTIPPCFFRIDILHTCFMLVTENMGHNLFYGKMLKEDFDSFIDEVNAVRAAHQRLQKNE